MIKCRELIKKHKKSAWGLKGLALGLVILALLVQANFTVFEKWAATLLGPSLKEVPSLEQNQALTDQPAADLEAMNASPILASEQSVVNYENKSKRTEHTKTIVGADGKTTKQISLAEPLHYKKDGSWAELKPAAEKNGDTVNLSVGDMHMSAKSLRKGVEYTYKGKKFSVSLKDARDVKPQLIKKDGADVLLYENALDDVDITYTISGYSIKEALIVKKKTALTTYNFEYKGVTLSDHKDVKGAIALGGLPDQELFVAPLNVVTTKGFVTDPIISQKIHGEAVQVTLDTAWLKGLPDDILPVTIDPTLRTLSKTSQDMMAMRSDGYRCGMGVCSPQTGNEEYPGYWAYWRTLLRIPFNEVQEQNIAPQVVSARLHLVRNGGAPQEEAVIVEPAACWDFNCLYSDSPLTYSYMTDDSWLDMTGVVNWMYQNGMTNEPLMLRAMHESRTHRDYKSFDLSQLVLEIQYWGDTPPPQPQMVYPGDKKVISELQPALSVNPVVDPDGEPVRYVFFLMSSPNDVISSVVTTDPHWVVPEGVLKDGVTYYWSANALYGQAPTFGAIQSFKVDMRRGKSATQSYDTIGPVSIDQATGNLSTSVSSHKLKALGGDIGVSLDYNTPAMSRSGLVAEYWDNETLTDAPKLTTLTPNIDFNWDMSSPLPYAISPSQDNFSARYTSTLTVPQAGAYTFGAEYDDGVRIYVNNALVLDAWNAPPGTAYGTPVTLTPGVSASIKVEYREATSSAKLRLLAKSPMVPAGQLADRAWFKAAVKPFSNNGLSADYYRANDANGTFPNSLLISASETSFNYESNNGLVSKVPGGTVSPDLVRYKGMITVPVAGSYKFSAEHRGGLRMSVNNQQIIDNWNKDAFYSNSTTVNITANSPTVIQIDYWAPVLSPAKLKLYVEGPGIARQILPASWLTQQQNALPAGWQLGVDSNGSSYDALRVNGSSVTLVDSSGSTHEYKWENNAFTPPANERGILARGPDGTHTFKAEDGREYIFATDGTLTSMVAPTDDKKPSALKYIYTGAPKRLTKIVDSVNAARFAELFYYGINTNGNCAPPSGFDTPPTGYLCSIRTSDGVETNLRYKAGNLARIVGAGSHATDFGYDSLKRIVNVRDPLANDAIAASIRTTADGSTYDIGYDAVGRAKRVVFPAATVGAARMANNYVFMPGATLLRIDGASEPSGYSQRIEYDESYRTVKTFGLDGKTNFVQWHANKDIVLSTTDQLGLKTAIQYDPNDRPITKYGPAPVAWYGSDNKPLAAQVANVPKTDTKYDESMQGLSASFYDNKHLVREPKARSFEKGDLVRQWTSANRPVTPTSEGWGVRLTGEVLLPVAGDYTFKAFSDDGVKVYIDNKLYIDSWTDGDARFHQSAMYKNDTAGKRVNFRIDYYDKDQNDPNSKLELRIYKPGATEAEALLTRNFLVPNFSLTTSESVTDSVMGQITNTRTYGRPEYGMLDKVTLDPSGLNYVSTTNTETPGSGFFRQTGKTLPGGNKTTYQHYGTTDNVDNPCTTAADPAPQAGLPKGKTEPDPDGAGPLTAQRSEMIYDSSGQVVAARINNEPYTCTTYDARGRVTKVVTPANGGRPGMTSETTYAVGGNPLKMSTVGTNGTVTSEIDLLGRTVKYTDANGNTTSPTYDAQGKVTVKTSTHLGKESFTYDNLDRVTKYAINDVPMANMFYDEFSRVKNIDYPASNLKLIGFEYDPTLRIKAANWRLSDGTNVREEQTKSTTGLITTNKRTIGAEILNQSFTYDKAGRLRTANVGTHTMSYGFDAPPATCGASYNVNAHKNANRTSQIVDGVTTTYCYDLADRLISSSDANYNNPVYDDRGNITQIGSNGKPLKFAYDQANRVIRIEQRDASGNGAITEFKREAGGRIVERKQSKLTGGTATIASQVKYGYSTPGDSPDIITNMTDGLLRRVYSLPGGITLTIHANEPDQSKQRIYSIPNLHGDTMLTTDYFGVKTGVYTYDPFGNQLDSTTPPQNNATPGTTKGYLGQHDRLTEVDYSIPLITMGERVYLPGLGRFMQPDPVEGGNANAYIYPADPVNSRDVDGNFAFLVPVAWFVARVVITAVISWVVDQIIQKVVPPPYRAPIETAVNIASFASPGRWIGKAVSKAPAYVPKPAKLVQDVYGGSEFKSTISFGQKQHRQFKDTMSDPNLKVYMEHADGKRGFADAITNTHVFELKPDNEAARKRGLKQLQKYADTKQLNGQLWVYSEKLGEFRLYAEVKPR